MFKRRDEPNIEEKAQEKVIDIEARMEGNLKFNTPTNLRINGKFEGELETKGTLTIGEKADVKARVIKGENIIIAGKVSGNIISEKRLELSASAKVIGDIKTPILIINEGAMLKGHCQIPFEERKNKSKESLKKNK